MPVEEHDIHPSTQHGDEFRYGCWNRPDSSKGYFAPHRTYRPDGTFFDTQKFIPHRMSRECRYDISLTDNGCRECKHRGNGEAYDKMVRSLGK